MSFPYIFPLDFVTGNGGTDTPRITDSILASGLQNSEHVKAFDIITRDRYQELDLTPILIYMIDTVPAVALPHLAAQFDILGYKGWRFVSTEQEKRDLLKQAIELHRYKGTPWSIKEAVRRIGFPDAEIIEGVGRFYDGTFNFNGSVTYNGLGNWACFRVVFDLGNYKGINAEQTNDLQQLVNEYKNVRSKLVDISFKKNITEEVVISDACVFSIQYAGITEDFVLLYNNVAKFDGSRNYSSYAEDFIANQIT